MKTVVIIQARMGSTRLPGKVLTNLCGHSVLAHVLNRVGACPSVDEIVVATTVDTIDDPIVNAASALGVAVFRGSESDVLARYYLAAQQHAADVVVRVTSDCPLFDSNVLEQMLAAFFAGRSEDAPPDYLSNTLKRTFPRGLDAEIFTFQALKSAYDNAKAEYEHEHVTPYIYQNPELFMLKNFAGSADNAHHRWTLDTPQDLALITEIYDSLYRPGHIFTTEQVLLLLENRPEIFQLNAEIEQKPLVVQK